ncbi:F1/F0 ATPase, Methanosarcina type subunit 2 [Sulfuricella denitrificans skB26]|uniref:F1/F0 ATPase, Methanosarcina type subunit 2 n=1 Tax=Sulfuricella denitrificans (strain DSM 22764 / NBRC 105220 / skB26) TaxID=1163617 RepID=S6AJ13_SULDS|nr:ATP synthase subunit I [Sulfuricella denitrificans]BAN34539.1 F1/F0 ATPase, Methanosarcina type subunit 2 [Sulfuricella denitrificans skB26]
MNEPLNLMFALGAGIFLGAFFFGGLWWTVQHGVSSRRPALWFIGSMLLRTFVVLLGFYFISGENWQRLLAALLGFVIARLIVTRLTRVATQSCQLAQEASHAP